ncbi:RecX family transcriptional regulator [bacterium]|nr:RecX family transcriptional regulator [bacterium]
MKITKISPQQKNLNRWNIFVDGRFCFSIDENILTESDLSVNDSIQEQEIENLKNQDENWQAWRKSCDLLNRRMYSSGEIRDRLFRKGFSETSIQFAIQKLLKNDYLNDEEFATVFVREKLRLKQWGFFRIKMELKKRWITDEIIEKIFSDIEDLKGIETENLSNLISKSALKYDLTDVKEKQRIIHWLQRRGYSINLILENLKGFDTND